MTMQNASRSAEASRQHASPLRESTSTRELGFALGGGAVAWGVALLATYAVVDVGCAPVLRGHAVSWNALATVALGIDVLALIVASSAAWIALRVWRRTRHEREAGAEGALEVGEGRTRFLAIWGLAFDLVFAVVILVQALATLMLGGCAVSS